MDSAQVQNVVCFELEGQSFFFGVNMIQFFAAAGALLAAAIWGFAFVVVKDSLSDISACYMLAFRFSIAAVVLGIVFFKRLKKINVNYLKKAGIIGIFLFLAYLFQTIGCNYTTPGKNAFLTTIYVVLIPFYGWFFYKKRPAWFVFVAVILQIIGIAFLSLGDDLKNGIHLNLGDSLTLVCGIFYCLQIFYQADFSKNSEENDPFVYAFLEFSCGAILSWVFAPFYNAQTNSLTLNLQPFPLLAFESKSFIVSVLYLGILSTAVAFVLQNIGLKYLHASFATILLSFESVFGMLFSILFPVEGSGENLTLLGIIGCVLIFAAVILAQKEEK